NPRWSADGCEIFYFDPARSQVMAVSIEAGTTLRAAQSRAVFEQRNRDWDVTPDGKRFLVRRLERTEESQAKLPGSRQLVRGTCAYCSATAIIAGLDSSSGSTIWLSGGMPGTNL